MFDDNNASFLLSIWLAGIFVQNSPISKNIERSETLTLTREHQFLISNIISNRMEHYSLFRYVIWCDIRTKWQMLNRITIYCSHIWFMICNLWQKANIHIIVLTQNRNVYLFIFSFDFYSLPTRYLSRSLSLCIVRLWILFSIRLQTRPMRTMNMIYEWLSTSATQ